MSKPCHFFQNKNEIEIFTINKPSIRRNSRSPQYFHCFIVCILVPYASCFSCQQNIVSISISAAFRGTALIRGQALIRERRLFQCGYQKVRRLLESGAYLRPSSYQRKYGISQKKQVRGIEDLFKYPCWNIFC